MPHTTYTLEELAGYLHQSVSDIERLVREKEIPCSWQGKRLVFRRKEVDAWANQRILGMNAEKLSAFHKKTTGRAHDLSIGHALISELLRPACLNPLLPCKTKPSLIRAMVELADKSGCVNYADDLRESILAREKLGSTAMAGGFALLHTEYHDSFMFEDSFIAVARSAQPIAFSSPDGQLTDVFFLLCCQDERIHLHVLARMCMLCQQTSLLLELRECTTADEMRRVISEKEEELIRTT
ncbi:MAG: PTS sugar transporter subunit IIA [Kiritimatiellae bacterium]|nr:PTS sugar transporter subunit IIA [Kiritimatiellia bacterium]